MCSCPSRTLHVSWAIAIPGYAAQVSVRAGSVIAHLASLNKDGPKPTLGELSVTFSATGDKVVKANVGRSLQNNSHAVRRVTGKIRKTKALSTSGLFIVSRDLKRTTCSELYLIWR
jgi:hypothetical protein